MIYNFSDREAELLSNYSDVELIEFADSLNNYILENFGIAEGALAGFKQLSKKKKAAEAIKTAMAEAKSKRDAIKAARGGMTKREAKKSHQFEGLRRLENTRPFEEEMIYPRKTGLSGIRRPDGILHPDQKDIGRLRKSLASQNLPNVGGTFDHLDGTPLSGKEIYKKVQEMRSRKLGL